MLEHLKKLFLLILVTSLWAFAMSTAYGISLSQYEHCHPTEYEKNWSYNLVTDVKRDFTMYFGSGENLQLFFESFVTAGIFANTGLDRSIARHWQEDIRNGGVDGFFTIPKAVGGFSYYYLPFYLLCMSVGHMREHTLFGNVMYTWAYRSLRTFVLGGLQQVTLTYALGSGRPLRNEDSKWQPFRYNCGVSGHAFYGAIPFITAAQMTDQTLPRYALYVMSALPGLSRINSNCHYFSQVLLGWTIAILSANAVYNSDQARIPTFQVGLTPRSDGAMISVFQTF